MTVVLIQMMKERAAASVYEMYCDSCSDPDDEGVCSGQCL